MRSRPRGGGRDDALPLSLPTLRLALFEPEAFDHHHQGSGSTLVPCAFPEDAPLLAITWGDLRAVDDPDQPLTGITVYSTERAQKAAEYFRGSEVRESEPVGLSEAVLG